jgi:hypothetical protein
MISPTITRDLLLGLDYKTTILCITEDPLLRPYLQDASFWNEKSLRTFRRPLPSGSQGPSLCFLKHLIEDGNVEMGAEHFLKGEEIIRRAIRNHRPDLFRHYFSPTHLRVALEEYARLGDLLSVRDLLQHHRKRVKKFSFEDLQSLFFALGEGGIGLEILKDLQPLIPKETTFGSLIEGATRGRKLHKIGSYFKTGIGRSLHYAIENDDLKSFLLLLPLSIDREREFALPLALKSHRVDYLEGLLSKGVDLPADLLIKASKEAIMCLARFGKGKESSDILASEMSRAQSASEMSRDAPKSEMSRAQSASEMNTGVKRYFTPDDLLHHLNEYGREDLLPYV